MTSIAMGPQTPLTAAQTEMLMKQTQAEAGRPMGASSSPFAVSSGLDSIGAGMPFTDAQRQQFLTNFQPKAGADMYKPNISGGPMMGGDTGTASTMSVNPTSAPSSSSGDGFTSFLNNGQLPTGSTFKSLTSQTTLPDWYTNYAMQLLSNQQALGSQPMPTYQGPRVAEFSPTMQQGFGMTGQAATAYQPALNAATAATQGAINAPGGLGAAQPYLTNAGQSSVANINQYMNPYNDAVTNRIGEMGVRNLTENIMPQIEGRYIQAGQLGFGGRGGMGTPSGMMTDTSRAIRDTSADILAQQTAALQQGYTQAAGLAGTDLSRQANLATTAGGLGGQDLSRQLTGAGQLADMGAQAQNLGLTGAGALQQVGAAQQGQAQKNLDVAYGDFLRQQGYPQEQINNMMKTFQGVASGVPSATQEYGISPSGVKQEYSSTGKDIASALTAAAGIVGSLKGK